MTFAPVRLREAADSLAKASTPEPFSTSRTSNWVARGGGLPAYIQHIAHDLMEKRGKSESNAIQMAIGIVKNWAAGLGKVDENTRAAARKALAEWEKLKAGAKGKSVVQHSADAPSLADEFALREAALSRIVVLEAELGEAAMIALLGTGLLEAAQAWAPTLKRVASASSENERHEVLDGTQHVGTIATIKGYGPGEGPRFRAFAVNGKRAGDYALKSRQEAIDALRKHLEEGPARVSPSPNAGKFLVSNADAYSGPTTYTEFPDQGSARFAAGLPATPCTPEIHSQVNALGEALRLDLMTISGLDVPPLRRVQEARRRDPFDLISEAFNPGELRGFGGKWVHGGGHRGAELTARSVAPTNTRVNRPKSAAQIRYEGGVVRASARARAEHAAKPQIAPKDLPASIGQGKWSGSAASTSRRMLAQPVLADAAKLAAEIKAGRAVDTEHAHRAVKPDGSLGAYSAERKALHEAIITKMLQGKGVHERSARAIFTAGGPASGKGGLVKTGDAEFEKQIGKEAHVDMPSDVVHADPDAVRVMLPEYKALKAAGREDAANLTHEEASHIAKLLTRVALGRQHHVLVDTVGDSGPGKFVGKIRDAQNAGHRVEVHYATTDIATALERAHERAKKTGRAVPEDYLRSAHAAVSQRFPEVAALPGVHLRVIDTTSRPNAVIAERRPGDDKLLIRDAVGFRKFLDKGKS